MGSNSLGKMFTITSFGESHGKCVGIIVDGCPAGLPVSEADIQVDVDRRKASANVAATGRREPDRVEILSGTYEGHTTGAPICMLVWNKDVDSSDYLINRLVPRPGHSDYTAYMKYGGFSDFRGGGRFSGRITAGWVMAGAIARKLLGLSGIEILAHTVAIGGIKAQPQEFARIRENVNKNALYCADLAAAEEMNTLINEVKQEGDSLGGIIEGIALNVPVGLGEPVFDMLEGELAKALLVIPAIKAVEFGTGFALADKRGSESNDSFAIHDGRIVTLTNNSGGLLGGMSNGMPIVLRAAVKPTASIARGQSTVDMKEMTDASIAVRGRHDVCIVPRAVPVVEATMAITLCDFALRAGVIPRIIK